MGIYIVGEVIRRTRESLSISRKDLSEGICAIETLCRIENGERISSRANFQAMMERMGKCGEKYIPFIHSNEIDIIAQGKDLELLLTSRKYSELNNGLSYLKYKLSLEDNVNRQFILRIQAITDFEKGDISITEKRKMLVDALLCTVPQYREGTLPKGIFSRTEIMLLCNIAVSYAQEKEFETALTMFKQIETYFDSTSIDIKERAISETLALSNFAQCLGEYGETEKAIKIGEKAIGICVMTRKCGVLPNLLYNLAYEYEILGKNERAKMLFKQAYYVADLNSNINLLAHIEKHISTI